MTVLVGHGAGTSSVMVSKPRVNAGRRTVVGMAGQGVGERVLRR